MSIQKTKGIVLSSNQYNEGDIISLVFTKQFGKVNLIYKGLKKSKKRSQAITNIGSTGEFVFYLKPGKDTYNISDYSLQSALKDNLNNLDVFYCLSYIIEILKKTLAASQPDLFLYGTTKKAIELIETEENIKLLLFFYIIHILNNHGVMPDISSCKTCGTLETDEYEFEFHERLLICGKCTNISKSNFILTHSIVTFINLALKNKYEAIKNYEISDFELGKSIFIFSLFIEDYFNITLNSKEFIYRNN